MSADIDDDVLAAIGSTEASTFPEFCRGLASRPPKGDRDGWREVFASLERLQHQGLLTLTRNGRDVESLRLTPAGADRVRAKLDAQRGLFAQLV